MNMSHKLELTRLKLTERAADTILLAIRRMRHFARAFRKLVARHFGHCCVIAVASVTEVRRAKAEPCGHVAAEFALPSTVCSAWLHNKNLKTYIKSVLCVGHSRTPTPPSPEHVAQMSSFGS